MSGKDYRPAVALSRDAKDAISRWCDDHDEEIGKTVSKLTRWFVKADPLVQAVMLGRVLEPLADAHAKAIHKIAETVSAEPRVTVQTTLKRGSKEPESTPHAAKAEK